MLTLDHHEADGLMPSQATRYQHREKSPIPLSFDSIVVGSLPNYLTLLDR
jgi:hypothetical protein